MLCVGAGERCRAAPPKTSSRVVRAKLLVSDSCPSAVVSESVFAQPALGFRSPFVAGPRGGAWGEQLLLGFGFFGGGDLQPEVTQLPDSLQVVCGAGGVETIPCLLTAGATRPIPPPTIPGGFG